MAIETSAHKPRQYNWLYQLVSVQCANCNQGGMVNHNVFAEDEQAVIVAGAALHGTITQQTKVICASPVLMFGTARVLVDQELIGRMQNPVKVVDNGAIN